MELRTSKTWKADSWEEFVDIVENRNGFALAHWDGSGETEEKIKEMTKATIRCIPLDAQEEAGSCILTGKPSSRRVVFAKAY
jgi:prolyl-tRNA synthetase